MAAKLPDKTRTYVAERIKDRNEKPLTQKEERIILNAKAAERKKIASKLKNPADRVSWKGYTPQEQLMIAKVLPILPGVIEKRAARTIAFPEFKREANRITKEALLLSKMFRKPSERIDCIDMAIASVPVKQAALEAGYRKNDSVQKDIFDQSKKALRKETIVIIKNSAKLRKERDKAVELIRPMLEKAITNEKRRLRREKLKRRRERKKAAKRRLQNKKKMRPKPK
jgi:hypothetical protein